MKKKVAINGFGRIGRSFLRLVFSNLDYEVVAINDLANAETLAHLFKYDSIHGGFNGEVCSESNNLVINDYKIPVFQIKDDERFPRTPDSHGIHTSVRGHKPFDSKHMPFVHCGQRVRRW